jgi:aryl-alcohol dehydrogenase-like predicted oxidoreductase
LRSTFDRLKPETIAANMPTIELLRQIADREKATPSQVALAWLLAQKPFIVPIPGTRNMDHLTENLGAINVEFSAKDLKQIQIKFSTINVHGGRMNEMQMTFVDQTK